MTEDDTDTLIETTLRLDAEATPEPWDTRAQEFDDWGVVRGGPVTDAGYRLVVAQARAGRHATEAELSQHRAAKTDPYGPNAALIAFYRTAAPELARRLRATTERAERAERKALGLEQFSSAMVSERDMAWAALPDRIRERDDARQALAEADKALAEAAQTFRIYARNHEAKGTDEGDTKAKANRFMADRMEAALSHPPQQPSTREARIGSVDHG